MFRSHKVLDLKENVPTVQRRLKRVGFGATCSESDRATCNASRNRRSLTLEGQSHQKSSLFDALCLEFPLRCCSQSWTILGSTSSCQGGSTGLEEPSGYMSRDSVRPFIGVNKQEVDENLKKWPAWLVENQQGDHINLSSSAPSMSSNPALLCNSTPISYDAARNRPGRLFRLSPVSTTSLASIDTSLEGTKHLSNALFATTARQASGLVSAAHLLKSEGSKSDESIGDKQQKTARCLSGIDFDPNHDHYSDDLDVGSAAESSSISHVGQQAPQEVGECGQHLSLVQLNKGESSPLSSMELQEREHILDWKFESVSQEKYEMTNKTDDGFEKQQRPHGAAANVSDSLLQSLKLQPCSPSLNEQQVETAFTQLSLAFQNDKFTLDKRLRLEARARDLVEEDFEQEIENMKWALQQLELQCQEQVQQELLQQLQQTLQVLHRCSPRLSSQAEMLGAVNQEGRLARAAEVMLLYVEQLRRTCAREQTELSELRRLLHDNTRSSASSADNFDDPLGRNKRCLSMSASSGKQVTARRRMSVAVIPKFSFTSPSTLEQPTRSPNFPFGMETKEEAEQKETIKKGREEKKCLSIETMEKHGLRIEQPLEERGKEELEKQKEQNINLVDDQEKFASLLQAKVEEKWPATLLRPKLFDIFAVSILLIGTALCILGLFLLHRCSGAAVQHPA
uniref:Lymphoid-restricted membrane protein n=1 Tax=Eptatretus burgeri TaxID=7764 RepID=A0A8C4R219_EPTBU